VDLASPSGSRWWGRPAVFWTGTVLFVLIGLGAELRSLVRPDIGFLLYAAGRVLDGAKLYVDIVEINPPLIIALNIPPALLGRLFGVSAITVYRLGFGVVLCGALTVIWHVLGRAIPADRLELKRVCLLLSGFALFPMAAQDFGQREHLLLALVLPYLFSAAGRAGGRNPTSAEAIGIGTLVGVAMALKPHFLPLWIATEVFVRRSGKADRPWTPEGIVVGLVLVAYAAIVLFFTPEYLTLVLKLGALYNRFLHDSFFPLLATGPGASLVWVSLLTYAALRRHAGHSQVWDVLAIGVLTCFLGAALQQKGLRYHFYPAFALAVILLGVAATDLRLPVANFVQRIYRQLAITLAISAVLVVLVENLGQLVRSGPSREQADLDALVREVRRHAAGKSVFVMSYHIGSAFPLVNYSGVELASRFPHLWLLAAAYMDELKAGRPLRYRQPDAMPDAERYLNEAVLADLQRYQPAMLIVLRNARDLAENGYRRLDYLAYFGRDPRIGRILSGYERIGLTGEYALYRQVRPGEPRTGPAPAPELATQDVLRSDRGGLQLRIKDPAFLLRLIVFIAVLAAVLYSERRRPPRAIHV
jgi:hypothetical protein